MIKNDLESVQPDSNKLHGIYRGVIEDNSSDPLKSGRCKVRVVGVHTDEKEKSEMDGIPTDELPWAEPALGLFEGSVSGFGNWTVPLQGSHVFVFFEGGHPMKPRFFASVPGVPTEEPDGGKGFNDPDEKYPISETNAPHQPNQLNEPDFHRLGRNEKISDTIVQSKNDSKDTGVSTADGSSWDEPDSYYAAEYPDNKVFSTRTGITVEIDDTDGDERIHVYHPSNSYIEINKDGSIVVRNAQDKFEIVDNDKKQHIMNDLDRTVDNNRTSKVGQNETENIGNNRTREIGNNNDDTIGNNRTTDIGVDDTTTIGSNRTESIGGNSIIDTSGSTTNTSQSDTNLNGSTVNLNEDKGTSGKIVTTEHICALTGLPHPDGSSTCNANK